MSVALTLFGKRQSSEMESRSFENPAVSLSDPTAFDGLFGSVTTSSGIKVNRDTALSYAAVWRAINLISKDVGRVPLSVLKRTPDGGKEKDRRHPAYTALRRQSGKWLSAFYFKQILTSHALLHGNGFAEIIRDGDGSGVQFTILSPLVTQAQIVDNEVVYVTSKEGVQRSINASNMFHLKGLGFDGLAGHSVLSIARNTLGLGVAAREYGSRFFANNARPSVVLQHPAQLSAEAAKRLRDSWQAMHGGVENTASTAVLEDGMSVQVLSMSAKDSQLLESRQFEIREIGNFFGVPSHKLGDPERKSFASLEQENQSYLDDGLDPWLCAWEEESWLKLLSTQEQIGDTHLVEFERAAISRTDLKTQTESLVMEVNNGLLTADEARAIRNRPPVPDGEGAKFRIPLNIGVMGEQQNEANSTDANRQRGLVNVVRATSERICKRIASDIANAAGRDNFVQWLDDEFEGRHRSVTLEHVAPVIQMVNSADDGDSDSLSRESIQWLFDEVREVALEACEVRPDDLDRSLKRCGEHIASVVSSAFANKILNMRCNDVQCDVSW